MWARSGKHVQPVDLIVDDDLPFHRHLVNEVVHGFGAIEGPVVNGLEVPRKGTLAGPTDK